MSVLSMSFSWFLLSNYTKQKYVFILKIKLNAQELEKEYPILFIPGLNFFTRMTQNLRAICINESQNQASSLLLPASTTPSASIMSSVPSTPMSSSAPPPPLVRPTELLLAQQQQQYSYNNEQGGGDSDPLAFSRLNLQQPSVSMGYLQMSIQENGSGKFLQGVKVGEKVAQVMTKSQKWLFVVVSLECKNS